MRATISQRMYRWTRDLHLYVGLFLSPFVLVFALSALMFTRAWTPGAGGPPPESWRRRAAVTVPDEENGLELAKQVLKQLDLRGEIGWLDRKPAQHRLSFPVEKPGQKIMVRVNLATGQTEIEQQNTGAWDALVFLHKKPGPHNADIRGNWVFSRLWGWLADATIYLLLFLSASGVYLWAVLRAERRVGLAMLGTGMLSFVLVVLAIVG